MYNLLVCLRSLQLMSQHFHNVCARVPFHQDHEFFASVYEAAASDYDDVIERIIGLQGEEQVPLQKILADVCLKLKNVPSSAKENSMYYELILAEEKYICDKVKELISAKLVTPGTEQLIGDIANKSEVRQYKIKQRLKK